MKNILVFCNADSNGNISDVLVGENIIPDKQYDYFVFTNDENVLDNILAYKVDVTTRTLVLK